MFLVEMLNVLQRLFCFFMYVYLFRCTKQVCEHWGETPCVMCIFAALNLWPTEVNVSGESGTCSCGWLPSWTPYQPASLTVRLVG